MQAGKHAKQDAPRLGPPGRPGCQGTPARAAQGSAGQRRAAQGGRPGKVAGVKGEWGRPRLLSSVRADYTTSSPTSYPQLPQDDSPFLTETNRRELVSGTSQIVVLLTPTDPEVIFLVHFEEAK
ncbi:hypothetical protein LA080_001631 [Diaporthe eres]|nr:hypothetical protein LA080_001631 [Diaporthe eres]